MKHKDELTLVENLAGRLTLWGAEDLRASLMAYCDTQDKVQLVIADQDEIDTAGIQVLIAAQRENPDLTIKSPSVAVAGRLGSLGLQVREGRLEVRGV